MVRKFIKTDGECIRAVKINILEQSESLAAKLAERRRKRKHPYGKRHSKLNPESTENPLSRSFYSKEIEDSMATDVLQGFGLDHPNSFQIDTTGESDFKEIFNVLAELEDDSNLYGDINNPIEGESPESSPEDEKREEYDQKKEEFLDQYKIKKTQELAEIKKTYDDEISKLKAQGKNKMIKGMIKNVKKEREEAVGRVKKKFKDEKDKYLESLSEKYNIEA